MTSTCIYMIGSPSSSYTLLNENYSGFYSYCNIYVGSTAYSIYNDSGSTLNSSLIRTVASSSQASLSGPVSPTPEFNATSHADPLAYVTAPASPASSANCTHTTTSITTTSTIGPGTYCNGLNISGASVILTSGLYIVTGGISWTNGSTVTGSGVTIYLTNGAGYGYGALSITNSTVTLSAPTSSSGGALAGIVMFTDRNWVSSSWPVSINASFVTTDGIWYLPGVGISNYSSTLKGTNYLGLVAYAVFGYAATFRFPSPNYSTLTAGNPFQNPYVGSLVE
jgi:hypothetical protein